MTRWPDLEVLRRSSLALDYSVRTGSPAPRRSHAARLPCAQSLTCRHSRSALHSGACPPRPDSARSTRHDHPDRYVYTGSGAAPDPPLGGGSCGDSAPIAELGDEGINVSRVKAAATVELVGAQAPFGDPFADHPVGDLQIGGKRVRREEASRWVLTVISVIAPSPIRRLALRNRPTLRLAQTGPDRPPPTCCNCYAR